MSNVPRKCDDARRACVRSLRPMQNVPQKSIEVEASQLKHPSTQVAIFLETIHVKSNTVLLNIVPFLQQPWFATIPQLIENIVVELPTIMK